MANLEVLILDNALIEEEVQYIEYYHSYLKNLRVLSLQGNKLSYSIKDIIVMGLLSHSFVECHQVKNENQEVAVPQLRTLNLKDCDLHDEHFDYLLKIHRWSLWSPFKSLEYLNISNPISYEKIEEFAEQFDLCNLQRLVFYERRTDGHNPLAQETIDN